nr:hypothetical protein CFP56_45727 [Quercus suber]
MATCLGLGYCMPWPWLHACPGLSSMHALALAVCLWQRAFTWAAACLGLDCVPMGLPWPCVPMAMFLSLGCVPIGAALAQQRAYGGWIGLGCMPVGLPCP